MHELLQKRSWALAFGSSYEDNLTSEVRMRSEFACVRNVRGRSNTQAVRGFCRLFIPGGLYSDQLSADFIAQRVPERMERLSRGQGASLSWSRCRFKWLLQFLRRDRPMPGYCRMRAHRR